jgi:hypothetical protein
MLEPERLLKLLPFDAGDGKRIVDCLGPAKNGSQSGRRWDRALNPSLSKAQVTKEEEEELWNGLLATGERIELARINDGKCARVSHSLNGVNSIVTTGKV